MVRLVITNDHLSHSARSEFSHVGGLFHQLKKDDTKLYLSSAA